MTQTKKLIEEIIKNTFGIHSNVLFNRIEFEGYLTQVAEAAKAEERERIIKELRISEGESIDCPMSVCCESCYGAAIEDRLEVKALLNNPEAK